MTFPISEQGWNIAAWTMIYFLVGGTLFALVGVVLRLALRRAQPATRYALSLGLLAVLAAMPLGIAGWLAESQPGQRGVPLAILSNPTVPVQTDSPTTSEPGIAESTPVIELKTAEPVQLERVAEDAPTQVLVESRQDATTIWRRAIDCLPWVWLGGSPLTFLFLSAGLVGTGRLRRRCQLLSTGPIIETSLKLRQALGVGRQVGIAICDSLVTPVLVGIVRPLVLLPPAALTGWNASEVEMVLVHELAHVRRWDNLVNLLQRIVESLLFFHPCVWWVSRWVRRDREECCDAVVIAHTAKPQAYAELLVALASPTTPYGMATSAAMARHPLAHRIRRILKLEDEPMLVTRKTIWLVACGALAIVLSTPLLLPSGAEESTDQEPEVSGNTVTKGAVGEKESQFLAELQIVRPQTVFSDPRAAELWEATQITLLKSDLVLRGAYDKLDDTVKESGVFPQDIDAIAWMSKNLDAQFSPSAIILKLPGEMSQRLELLQVLQRIMESYAESLDRNSKPKHNSPFPTLEEQKAADTAYRILGFELEKLTDEQLARVKKLGFQGGLRVAFVRDDIVGRGGGGGGYGGRGIRIGTDGKKSDGSFADGDILVGLHVWPTATIQQVNEILTREDLPQLIPLKYYKIVQVPEGGQQAADQQEMGMGRGAGNGGRGGYGRRGEFAGGYAEGEFGGEMGAYGEGMAPAAPMVDKVVTGRFTPNMNAWQSELQRHHNPNAEQTSQAANNPFVAEIPQAESKLVYDGKTFEEWKKAWQRDLSIAFRVQAVKAFVAFANAGVGKEAVAEILEIAGQYRWPVAPAGRFPMPAGLAGNQWTQPLKETCVAVFDQLQIPVHLAVESLAEAADTSNENLRDFYHYVITNLALKTNQNDYDTLRDKFPDCRIYPHGGEDERSRDRGRFSGRGFIGGRQQSPPSQQDKSKAKTKFDDNSEPQQSLLYDGKTFDQWKQSWLRDISPDFRKQAVNAFVTYANSGKGKEAVNEILQIAGSYRWDFWAGDSSGDSVKRACAEVFTERQIPMDLILAELTMAKESPNDRIKSFAQYVVHELANNSRKINETLRKEFPDANIPTQAELAVRAVLDQGIFSESELNRFRQLFAADSEAWIHKPAQSTGQADDTAQEEPRFDDLTYEEWNKLWKSTANADARSIALHALGAFAYKSLEGDAVQELLALCGQFDWNGNDVATLSNTYCYPDCIKIFAILPLDNALDAVIAAKGSGNPFLPFAVVTLARRSAEANALLRKEFPDLEIPEYREPPENPPPLRY